MTNNLLFLKYEKSLRTFHQTPYGTSIMSFFLFLNFSVINLNLTMKFRIWNALALRTRKDNMYHFEPF